MRVHLGCGSSVARGPGGRGQRDSAATEPVRLEAAVWLGRGQRLPHVDPGASGVGASSARPGPEPHSPQAPWPPPFSSAAAWEMEPRTRLGGSGEVSGSSHPLEDLPGNFRP